MEVLILLQEINTWPISYEMSRTFINRAVHAEAHFSRLEAEYGQNGNIAKCSVHEKCGGCMTDATRMIKSEVQEVCWSEIES